MTKSKSTLSDAEFDDDDMVSVSERHHQIMLDGNRLIRRIFYGCLTFVFFVCAFLYFFFKK